MLDRFSIWLSSAERALSRKERVKPGRLRAMAMTIQSRVKRIILAAQSENRSKEEHEVHLKVVLELLKKEELFAKLSKCEIQLQEVLSTFHFELLEVCIAYIGPEEVKYAKEKLGVKFLSDYDCEIRYHPGKVNIMVRALSRKERVKPEHLRAMAMTSQSRVKRMILAA
ncbi:hypothetical protein Tco_1115623 [Tanacetum coccineum]